MKNRLTVFIALVIAAALLAYMFTFQVRYDQVAVLTTFDRATDTSIKRQPGLYMKIPWPIQQAHLYSTRIQLLDHRLEQLSTQDGKTVAISVYLAWRIGDPHQFFVQLQSPQSAQNKLAPLLSQEISSTIGRYRMDQLVNTDKDQVKIAQIEAQALDNLRNRLATLGYGIDVMQIGIRRLLLPSESTAKVFQTMRKTRQRLASLARSSGNAQAMTITSQAQSAKQRILAFAQHRAQAIRAQGDIEAAQYYSAFKQDQSLAIFLRKIDTLKSVLPHNTTFVLDANQLSLDQLFNDTTPDDTQTTTNTSATQPQQ